jgi:ribosome-associated translation inhibitor RaiA
VKVPPEVSYKGFQPMESQVLAVEKHISQFENAFPQTNSICVVVTCPGKNHRNGDMFEVSIRARLPTGKEIDVSHTPNNDDRYGDFYFALNDAFKRARRQLKDKTMRLRGEVKTHVAKLKLPDLA